jgi:hypothetical protein
LLGVGCGVGDLSTVPDSITDFAKEAVKMMTDTERDIVHSSRHDRFPNLESASSFCYYHTAERENER